MLSLLSFTVDVYYLSPFNPLQEFNGRLDKDSSMQQNKIVKKQKVILWVNVLSTKSISTETHDIERTP